MNRGFTLVELSIVLVIVGLLIGGILIAESMIETTQVQRFTRDLEKYEIAINNFRNTFKAIPGDTNLTTPPGRPNNELGTIAPSGSFDCAPAPYAAYHGWENSHFWAHMSQTKMIDQLFVPYSPSNCGGTHSDSGTPAYSDGVVPYLKFDRWKTPITANKTATSNILLQVNIPPSWYLALQAKFGFKDALTTTAASTGFHFLADCVDYDAEGTTACTDSGADWGELYYYLPPI